MESTEEKLMIIFGVVSQGSYIANWLTSKNYKMGEILRSLKKYMLYFIGVKKTFSFFI